MNGPSASHASVTGTRPADLVLLDGKVVTLDDRMPEAQAVAVHDGLITAAGTTQEIKAAVNPRTEVIDLAGRRVIPGFVEGHGHLTSLGYNLATLNLGDAGDWREIGEGGMIEFSYPTGWWTPRRWARRFADLLGPPALRRRSYRPVIQPL